MTIFAKEKWFNKYLKKYSKTCQGCYEDKWRNISYAYDYYSYYDIKILIEDNIKHDFEVYKDNYIPYEDYSGYFKD